MLIRGNDLFAFSRVKCENRAVKEFFTAPNQVIYRRVAQKVSIYGPYRINCS